MKRTGEKKLLHTLSGLGDQGLKEPLTLGTVSSSHPMVSDTRYSTTVLNFTSGALLVGSADGQWRS